VEWVETTGKTIAEALEAALDRLGVAEADAEVVVLEEPRNVMFGLRRSGARIRARVRPVQARAKRPSRRQSSGGSGDGRPRRNSPRAEGRSAQTRDGSGERAGRDGQSRGRSGGEQSKPSRSRTTTGEKAQSESTPAASSRNRSRSRGGGQRSRPDTADEERTNRATGAPKEEEMSIEAQAELAETFVRGVVHGFGVDATVESSVEDDVIQVRVVGEGLGLLVGPRGVTVDALQELTRTAVQHRSDEHAGRIHVDVAGYRARRAAALQDFARRVAGEVVASGQSQALEPMNAVDRKAVHDAVGEVAGAATSSEGEDPRRYVVIRPAASASEAIAVPDEADETDEDDDAPTDDE
jgi:spoIIIJ-associated protein